MVAIRQDDAEILRVTSRQQESIAGGVRVWQNKEQEVLQLDLDATPPCLRQYYVCPLLRPDLALGLVHLVLCEKPWLLHFFLHTGVNSLCRCKTESKNAPAAKLSSVHELALLL